MTMIANELTETAPKTLGKYQIIRELGRGNMGTVYLGYDSLIGRDVAIKVAHPEYFTSPHNSELYKQLFFNEARMAGILRHQHITAILDASVENETYYIVMEYVAGGQTLKHFCAVDKLLSIREVVTIIYKCAMALDYAHKKSIIHRDIKPRNILLTQDNEVKISDFGIAVQVNQNPEAAIGYAGSPLYMSPEQVRQDPLTGQSDLFSLGIVMYELLAGKHPFPAKTMPAIREQILQATPPPLREYRSDIPKILEVIMHKVLAKDLTQRYKTGLDLAGDLSLVFDVVENTADVKLRREKYKVARRLPFFRGFTEMALWELINASIWQKISASQEIALQSQIEKSFFIIIAGKVLLSKEGHPSSLLQAGDCFGELGLLAGQPRVTTLRAVTDAIVMSIQVPSIERSSVTCQLGFYQQVVDALVERLARPPETTVQEHASSVEPPSASAEQPSEKDSLEGSIADGEKVAQGG